jgi:hypothetical protein
MAKGITTSAERLDPCCWAEKKDLEYVTFMELPSGATEIGRAGSAEVHPAGQNRRI